MGNDSSNLTRCLILKKKVDIDVSGSAAPKLALGQQAVITAL